MRGASQIIAPAARDAYAEKLTRSVTFLLMGCACMRFWLFVFIFCFPLSTVGRAQDQWIKREIAVGRFTAEGEASRFEAIAELQQKVWQTKVTFQCENMRLDKMVEALTEKTGLSIRVDNGFLVHLSSPVTVDVSEVSLHSTLVMLLRPRGLAYRVDPDEIVITTLSAALHSPPIHFYETSDILPETPDLDPNNWDVLGPFREIADDEIRFGGIAQEGKCESYRNGVVVQASPRIHWEIKHLIEAVKKAKSLSSDHYSTTAIELPHAVANPDEVYQKLRTQRITWSQQDTTLAQVMKAIRLASGVPVCSDTEFVRHTELVGRKRLLNVDWEDRTIEQALDELTTEYDAGWRIADDRIEITSKSETHRTAVLKVYPVRDLVWYGLELPDEVKARLLPLDPGKLMLGGGSGIPPPNPFFDSDLPSLPDYHTVETVLPWYHGTVIESFSMADCFVIGATPQVHEQIAGLLRQLRRQQHAIAPGKFLAYLDKVEKEVITVDAFVYPERISFENVQALAAQIKEKVAPGSWNGEDAYIVVTNRRMLLRHQRKVLRETLPILGKVEGIKFGFPTWDRFWW